MRSTKMKGTLAAGILATGLAVSATSAQAATFAVNNANNNGAGSLRSAINAAEGTAAAGHHPLRDPRRRAAHDHAADAAADDHASR